MSLRSALGLESSTKIRYGIVALGDISQESLMPGVRHTGNSIITALVTGDPTKASEVADQYDVPGESVYSYEQYDGLLNSGKVDALYVATPNWRHAEFAVPALKAGIHVLLEKPMEISSPLCQQIIDAQRANPKTRLMVAYRLHFEPATLDVINHLRHGRLGKIRSFSSAFHQPVDPKNHRAHSGTNAGPLFDMGPYPINAVRNLFEAEPIEVFATAERYDDGCLPMDFDHTVAVTLKFSESRVAQFTVSYATANVDTFTVTGTDAVLRLDNAYGMGKPKTLIIEEKTGQTVETIKPTDHFGGEVHYFSECILHDRQPEPDGQEGLLDVRVIEAVLASLKTGRPVHLEPCNRERRIDMKQIEKLRPVSPKEPVHVSSPSKESGKAS